MAPKHNVAPWLIIFALLLLTAYGCSACTDEKAPARTSKADTTFDMAIRDVPYEWIFDYQMDMQLPELPTGCEATAGSTLMRMNGIYVTKTDVADAMRKSDDDFVTHFLGDPYSYSGWACDAPCLTNTLNGFLDIEEKWAAVELTGTPLQELPLPCCVWVTIGIETPQAPVRTEDGYGLYCNSHCVVLRNIHDGMVSVIDPLAGDPDYDLDQFEAVYDGMGRQAVYVTDIGTAVRMIQERGIG